jgi:hypothetical protein
LLSATKNSNEAIGAVFEMGLSLFPLILTYLEWCSAHYTLWLLTLLVSQFVMIFISGRKW